MNKLKFKIWKSYKRNQYYLLHSSDKFKTRHKVTIKELYACWGIWAPEFRKDYPDNFIDLFNGVLYFNTKEQAEFFLNNWVIPKILMYQMTKEVYK